jgi:peptide/nickel transport system permease protein
MEFGYGIFRGSKMLRYIVKRILFLIPMLLAVIFIVYAIMDFTPGDTARAIVGERATEAQLQILRAQLGLGHNLFYRYGRYVWRLVTHFDFGVSYRTKTPVINDILQKFPYTLGLALLGTFFSSLIGIAVGIISAVKQYSRTDTAAIITAMFFAAIPNFWLAMMLILIFSLGLGLLPSNGMTTWKHLILPGLSLTLPASAGILRLTRSMMLETIRQDYIRTARAKGVWERVVILKHALKNAMMPVLTSLGLQFGALLGGAIITETVFAIPGIGTHIITAIRQKDTPVVLACTIFLSVFFSLIMLFLDITYCLIDPRLRAKHSNRSKA